MEKQEKRTRYFPTPAEAVLRGIQRWDLVKKYPGKVKVVGKDTVEICHVPLPEQADNYVFSAKIVPEALNFPNVEFRLTATERVNENSFRSVKVFCETSGRMPTAFYLDEKKGEAKMAGREFGVIYMDGNKSFSISQVWVADGCEKMKRVLGQNSGEWEKIVGKFCSCADEMLQKEVEDVLKAKKSYASAVVHALHRIWPTNGSANKVYAVRKAARTISPAVAPKVPPVEDEVKKAVGQILESVNTRAKEGAPNDGPVSQGSPDAWEALEAEAPRAMADPNKKPAKPIKKNGKRQRTRAEADATVSA